MSKEAGIEGGVVGASWQAARSTTRADPTDATVGRSRRGMLMFWGSLRGVCDPLEEPGGDCESPIVHYEAGRLKASAVPVTELRRLWDPSGSLGLHRCEPGVVP